MVYETLTPQNSAMVLIDHEVGFSNLIGSHTIDENVNAVVALAEIAQVFDLPTIVTAGFEDSPPGPLYPELAKVLGDTPVHHRADGFDAFFDKGFSDAIEQAGRKKLIMAGIQTDVCLAFTALTALDKGYEVYAVVDASAATTKETHDYALQRLIQAGAIPTNWLAVGSELLRSWTEERYAAGFANVIFTHLPSWKHLNAHTTSVRAFAGA